MNKYLKKYFVGFKNFLYLSVLINNLVMSKYKARVPKTNKDKLTAQDIKEEKQFFKIAIILTIVVIGIIYFLISKLA
ncbi:MAG: hypothetical protein LC107_10260 [Chitinophagales bacterium]|nr:hypothetical protein [Chitinophagales bacterium]